MFIPRYEFDAGIHYVGEMGPGQLYRTLLDHITDGQLEFAQMPRELDHVRIGEKQCTYVHGIDEWTRRLKKEFPGEEAAIDKYIGMVKATDGAQFAIPLVKLLPKWIVRLIIKTGLAHWALNGWSGEYGKSTMEVARSLTKNKSLQTMIAYDWMDGGTTPQNLLFTVAGQIKLHFQRNGGYFPVRGASGTDSSIFQSSTKEVIRSKLPPVKSFPTT